MKNLCIISDFDGTITEVDSLYGFFEKYAKEEWLDVEQQWASGEISSKECLIKEFDLVENLSPKLIEEYTNTIKVDPFFEKFYEYTKENDIDFYVVSDGVDYFINQILKKHNINGLNIVSNHGEFVNNKFRLSFPNDNKYCKNNSGTCKCKVVNDIKCNYKKSIYIGDSVSDFCVADKADILYAKKRLLEYCKENRIEYIPFNTFKDIDFSLNNQA